MLGIAALATESGVWLLARRNAQNAADAAAYGGTLVLAQRPPLRTVAMAEGAARETVTLNGFTAGTGTTVTAAAGTWNPAARTFTAGGTLPNAMRVDITQNQRGGFARLISTTAPQAWGGATAALVDAGVACTLSIPPPGGSTSQVNGTTLITGSASLTAPDCVIVSNAGALRSVDIGTNAAGSLRAAQIRASGECENCDAIPRDQLPGGVLDYHPPATNPYTALDDRAANPMSGLVCTNPVYRDAAGVILPRVQRGNRSLPPSGWVTVQPVPRTSATPAGVIPAICEDISPGNGQRVHFAPGTNYFDGQSLQMSSPGASVTGTGVTLVLTGSTAGDVGNIQLSGGTFTLIAPTAGSGVPGVYDGVVIYRDVLGEVSNSANDAIRIEGNTTSTLFGGVYAPTSEIQISGNTNTNPPAGASGGCTAYVGGRITFTGNSTIDITACPLTGTNVPVIQNVVLVQ